MWDNRPGAHTARRRDHHDRHRRDEREPNRGPHQMMTADERVAILTWVLCGFLE